MARYAEAWRRGVPRVRGLLLLLGTLGLVGCEKVPPSGPPSARDRQVIEERVQAYFRRAVAVGSNVSMTVTDYAPAALGLLTANLELSNGTQSQKIPIVVSRDGRWLVQGNLTDLTQDPFKATMEKLSLAAAPRRGAEKAPVTIVEFSDFQCPFCARAHSTLDEVLPKHGSTVQRIYKHFPLSNHPWAEAAAVRAACAQEQQSEAFWALYQFFFANQREITVDNLGEKTTAVLGDQNLDLESFATCIESKRAIGHVQADIQDGTSVGVRSTPTFFVNGRKLEGALPAEQFEAAILEALTAVPAQ